MTTNISALKNPALPHQGDLWWAPLDGISNGGVQMHCNCDWRGSVLPPQKPTTLPVLRAEYLRHELLSRSAC